MMRSLKRTFAALAALAIMTPLAHPQDDPDEHAAQARAVRTEVESGIAAALHALRDDELTKDEREEAIKAVFADRIDFDIVARLAIGSAWSDMTGSQRKEFTAEFTTHVLEVAAEATKEYDGEEVHLASEPERRRSDYTVRTHIVKPREGRPDERLAVVDFRLREREERWRIIDIRIAGISMAAGFRAQFEAVIERSGIERVLEILRDRNDARKRADDEPRDSQ